LGLKRRALRPEEHYYRPIQTVHDQNPQAESKKRKTVGEKVEQAKGQVRRNPPPSIMSADQKLREGKFKGKGEMIKGEE